MNRRILAASAALGLLATQAGAAEKTPGASGNWGFDLAGMDRSAAPGRDFFDYANGTAVSHIVIPPDRTNYGAFIALADLSEKRVHDILEQASAHVADAPTDGIGKAGAMYKAFMDEAQAETLGAAPMKPELAQITALKTREDFAVLQGRAQTTFQGSLFAMSIEPDAKDPTSYAISLGQSGLGMPDRDYYLEKQFAEKKAKYAAYVTQMLTLAGWPDPSGAAAKVEAFEQKIAAVSWARADERDPDKVYNPMTLDELTRTAPGFDWAAFFKAAGLGTPARVVVEEKSAIIKIAALAGATPIDTLQAWAAFHLATNAAPVLNKSFVTAEFDFKNKLLQGQPEERPRWKRAVVATEGALGEAVGEVYVQRYYPAASQAKMETLTHDLRAAFRVRLQHNSWMQPKTRDLAVAKLDAFDFQIGKPKKWRDYTALQISAHDLYGDVERGTAFEWQFWLGHLGHPVDKRPMGHDAADGERLQQPGVQRGGVPRRHTAAAVLQQGRRPRHQLRRDRRRHRSRDDAWLRRRRPQVQRERPAARLVDRGRRQTLRCARQALRRGIRSDGHTSWCAHQPCVDDGREHRRSGRADVGARCVSCVVARRAGARAGRHDGRPARVPGLGAGVARQGASGLGTPASGDRSALAAGSARERADGEHRCVVCGFRGEGRGEALSEAGGSR